MSYKGRIIGGLIGFLQSLGWIIHTYMMYNILQLWWLVTLLCYVALGLWLGKKYDEAKFYSEKDALTGLFNRRFILKILPKLLTQMDRRKERLSLFLLDCNNFKSINDIYGHKAGDSVLVSIASLLKKSTRRSDIVARWGGDEFLIIVPYTEEDNTNTMVKRIERELKQLSKEIGINISVSIGTAIYPDVATTLEKLINIADKNMYTRKDIIKTPFTE